jgi:CHAT domain-containing protein
MKRIAYLLSLWLLMYSTKTAAQEYDPKNACHQVSIRAIEYYQAAKYKLALPSIDSALVICKNEMSADSYYTMMAAYTISLYETVPEREDSVIAKGERVRLYFENVKDGYKYGIYNELLIRLGFCYANKGNYRKAIALYDIAIPYYKAVRGVSSQYYLSYTEAQAGWYGLMGDFVRAGDLYKMLRGLTTIYYGTETAFYILLTTNYGNNYANQSYYDSASVLYQESLSLIEKVYGKQHTEYAKGLGNLGLAYKGLNRISDALLMLEQARTIYIQLKADRTSDYGTTVYSLGQLYLEVENLAKAEAYLTEAFEVSLDNLGYYHPQIAMIFSSASSLYSSRGLYREAVTFLLRSKDILENTTGDSTSGYATVINNLGLAYSDVPKYDSAIYFLKKSLALKEILFGKSAYSTFYTLNNLGSVSSDMGNFKEALNYFNESRNIVINNYGNDHYNISSINGNIALVLNAMGEIQKADALLQQAFDIRKKYILQFTEGLSETEKYTYSSSIRTDTYMGMNFRNSVSLNNDWLYNSAVFYKGMLLEGSRGLASAFNQFTDPVLKKKAAEYLSLKAFIGQEFLKQASERAKNLTELYNRAENLERELLIASASYRSWRELLVADWKIVQSKLQPGDAAIEFLTYYPFDRKDKNIYYAALVIKKESKTPELVQLFTEDALNKLITAKGDEAIVKKLYRSSIKSTGAAPTASDSLYHIIWKPLQPSLKNVKRLFFSADGVLNKLNLAAIITPEGKRLIEDYEFVQMASTRSVSNNTAEPSFSSMQLWGGINYEATTSSTSDKIFTYLPGTLSEVKEISGFAATTIKSSDLKLANDANETAFKQLNGRSPEVLHIATHGFFFADQTKGKKAGSKFESSFDPLLRSGLALAGANDNWNNALLSADKEDGILTAYEIATLDLSKTKLVVLSACETGLGDVQSGEGVYGLQRAFKLAGVNYLVMSLWQVPDLETKEFMQTFYANCFKGMPIRKAFRETQLAMNKKYQPYQWAAFVLVE